MPEAVVAESPAKVKSPSNKKGKMMKVDTPMSCAETPRDTPSGSAGKDNTDSAEVDAVGAVALALENAEEEPDLQEDEEKELEGDEDWVVEERKLREENKKREEADRKKNAKMGMKEKVEMLDNLLQKAAAYTAFLRERMKRRDGKKTAEGEKDATVEKVVEAGASKVPKKRDGQFEHQERDPRQPKLVEGVMRKYQVEGLMWICSLYENGLNGILADEMGLGKTVQAISFLAHLHGQKVKGPFMVVVPLSTITNWQREFKRWAPAVDVLLYHGSKEERQRMRVDFGFEKRPGKNDKNQSYPVLLTSFEVAMNDGKKLQNLEWKYLIVDEGHRLKNKDCRLLRELKALKADNRLLLSGTPLQNNLTELWSLLHFILPEIFQELETFKTWFDFDEQLNSAGGAQKIIDDEGRNKTISKLHTILDPFLLRRLKTDVLTFLPPKREYVLLAPMTAKQVELNTAIRDKTLRTHVTESNGQFVVGESGNWEEFKQVNNAATSMQNVLMQMRKNCNHPYLFQGPTDAYGNIVADERMVKQAGKLQLLDRMLKLLHANAHKTLIFCQMTKMMDLLEDYLQMRGWACHRIDGNVPWTERQGLMDSYNKGSLEEAFVFLLSTRSGGLGINLVSADTVIIYDGDFNPQQDLQAMDRCHRIGQTKPVSVVRLLTNESIETRIFEKATNKRKLELVAIARKRFKVADKGEYGADYGELEKAGKSEVESDKQSLRKSLTEIKHSLTDAELQKLLTPKPLDEINKDIISDANLKRLLLQRDPETVIECDGKGWQFLAARDA